MSRQWQLHLAAVGFFFNVYTYLIDTTHLSKYFSTNPKTIFDAFDRKGAARSRIQSGSAFYNTFLMACKVISRF